MKENLRVLLKKSGYILIAGLIFFLALPTGCSGPVSSASNAITIDNLTTASVVRMTNGQRDRRTYGQKKSFPSGYSGEFWVMFSFSNMLHNKAIHVFARIYIYSGDESKIQKNKEFNLTDSTDNTLYWGENFDISTYADGDYAVFLMMDDLISGTTVGTKTDFTIGGQ